MNKLIFCIVVFIHFCQMIFSNSQLDGIYRLNLNHTAECYLELYKGKYILSIEENQRGSDVFFILLLSIGTQQISNDTLHLFDIYNNIHQSFHIMDKNTLMSIKSFTLLNNHQLKRERSNFHNSDFDSFFKEDMQQISKHTFEKSCNLDISDCYSNGMSTLKLDKKNSSFKYYILNHLILDGSFVATANKLFLNDRSLQINTNLYLTAIGLLNAHILPGFGDDLLRPCIVDD